MYGTEDQALPQYCALNSVVAIRIKSIEEDYLTGDYTIVPEPESGYTLWSFQVDEDYVVDNVPEVGGYYIRYPEGVEAFMSFKDFHDTFARV